MSNTFIGLAVGLIVGLSVSLIDLVVNRKQKEIEQIKSLYKKILLLEYFPSWDSVKFEEVKIRADLKSFWESNVKKNSEIVRKNLEEIPFHTFIKKLHGHTKIDFDNDFREIKSILEKYLR